MTPALLTLLSAYSFSIFSHLLNPCFSSHTGLQVLGHYIRRQQDPETFIKEIKDIASDPDDKYFFNVTDEAALNDIVDALGDRIFTLEGDAVMTQGQGGTDGTYFQDLNACLDNLCFKYPNFSVGLILKYCNQLMYQSLLSSQS